MAESFISVAATGNEELQQALRALGDQVQKKLVKKAMRPAMKPVLKDAKAYAPVGEEDGGRLKKSLKLRVYRRNRGRDWGIAVRTGTREELGIAADDPSYYPMSVEYGHVLRRVKGGPAVGTVPAHPFLRTALDKNRIRTLQVFEQGLLKAIEDYARSKSVTTVTQT